MPSSAGRMRVPKSQQQLGSYFQGSWNNFSMRQPPHNNRHHMEKKTMEYGDLFVFSEEEVDHRVSWYSHSKLQDVGLERIVGKKMGRVEENVFYGVIVGWGGDKKKRETRLVGDLELHHRRSWRLQSNVGGRKYCNLLILTLGTGLFLRTVNCLPLLRSIALAWGGGELSKGAKLRGTYEGKLAKKCDPSYCSWGWVEDNDLKGDQQQLVIISKNPLDPQGREKGSVGKGWMSTYEAP
ncbi:hypothetical protein CEXT_689501 [Caerostris extrusa]|uniref:Uncharacterized protein n=1 Tax=Caerostris extrusa TaxID=172846 RepID=A0AAV4RPG0_CAEEX|nr:hypothetical protein CEXT_689501 [Caerostris extrusa]